MIRGGLKLVVLLGVVAALLLAWPDRLAVAADRPNIVWLTVEDISPHIGAYGDTFAHTPNLDAFADRALRYDVAWSTAPVCSLARTALILGMYPTSVGGHHHRSVVGLPAELKMLPQLVRERGYYATNNVKEDYNVVPADGETAVWDDSSQEAHWRNRAEGQPFFAVFNTTLSHGSRIRQRTELPDHDPANVLLPPFHPDTPEFRRDWAQYYHSITNMDAWFGERLAELEEAGLLEETIVFFFSDHGGGMPGYKQLAYNTGLQVPLLVYVPEKYRHLAPADYKPGGFTRRPVEFVDFAPTVLSLIGAESPQRMQGRAFMGEQEAEPRQYVFGFRGRMDERYDMVRSVRDDRYLYIRNYMPHLKHGYFSHYGHTFASAEAWRELHEAGELVWPQTRVWEPKPAEELYDLRSDPYEVHNLVDSPHYQDVLHRMRLAHREHMVRTRDVAFLPEAEAHRRAKDTSTPIWKLDVGTSIYEMAQDPQRYPMERIFAMAELAANRSFQAVPMLEAGLDDEDSAVRYWAAQGVLIRGAEAFEAVAERIRQVLNDENPSVRIAAAEILAQYGGEDDAERALATLVDLARPERHGAYVVIEALNATGNLGEKARPIESTLAEIGEEDPNAPWRGANEFIVRLKPGYVHPGLEARRRTEREYEQQQQREQQ